MTIFTLTINKLGLYHTAGSDHDIFCMSILLRLDGRDLYFAHLQRQENVIKERAEILEPSKQILCNRQWTTLFCPIKTLQDEKDPLFANLYVDPRSYSYLNYANLDCAVPSNDEDFYDKKMSRM